LSLSGGGGAAGGAPTTVGDPDAGTDEAFSEKRQGSDGRPGRHSQVTPAASVPGTVPPEAAGAAPAIAPKKLATATTATATVPWRARLQGLFLSSSTMTVTVTDPSDIVKKPDGPVT
jgi:hypothetical protein